MKEVSIYFSGSNGDGVISYLVRETVEPTPDDFFKASTTIGVMLKALQTFAEEHPYFRPNRVDVRETSARIL